MRVTCCPPSLDCLVVVHRWPAVKILSSRPRGIVARGLGIFSVDCFRFATLLESWTHGNERPTVSATPNPKRAHRFARHRPSPSKRTRRRDPRRRLCGGRPAHSLWEKGRRSSLVDSPHCGARRVEGGSAYISEPSVPPALQRRRG